MQHESANTEIADQEANGQSKVAKMNEDKSEKQEDEIERQGWTKAIDFFFAILGAVIGYGNIWRFPYLCYQHGGGAFLVPYFLFLIILGLPLLALDMSLGQYFQSGPSVCFKRVCPLFAGTGYSMVFLSFLSAIYYIVILAWAFYYFFASFIAPLPWTTCNNDWNTVQCFIKNASTINASGVSPSEEYYNNRVLDISGNPDIAGPVKWDLALVLLLSWIVVYFAIFKGVKWTGKVVYFTATFPLLIMFILFIRGVTLPGSSDGIYYYLKVDTSKLANLGAWRDAGTQIFYTLGAGFGTPITLASYNKRSNNVIRNSLIIGFANCAASFFSGFVIFSMLGFMANQQGLSVANVVAQGPGLMFMVYPAGLATLPGANFWAVIFFFMLITLGIDTQFAIIEVVSAGMTDAWPKIFRKREVYLKLVICVVAFLIGLTCITRGGIYIFNLFNLYSAGAPLVIGVFIEIISVSWIYGVNRFSRNIGAAIGMNIWINYKICWAIIMPILTFALFILSILNYSPLQYNRKPYPWWADFVGWIMVAITLLFIAIPGVYGLITTKGTIKERFVAMLFVGKDKFEIEMEELDKLEATNRQNGNWPTQSDNYFKRSFTGPVYESSV